MTKTPTILGHVPCPICPRDAEVRHDRHGLAYIYCAHGCHTQVFSRDKHRHDMLTARMRPITAAVAESTDPAPAAAPVPAGPPARAKNETSPPTPPKARSTWLTTLLDKAPAK